MKNKQKLNEVLLNTAENLADEIIFKTATTFLEDLTKSIPVASIILNLTNAYSNYQTSKNQRQLLSFISQLQSVDPQFIEKFFLNKSNTELGFEILGILDQTYLEKQARMLGRTIILYKDEKISKQQFDKYTYIITKIDNYLANKIKHLHKLYFEKVDSEGIALVPLQPQEFISFGFIERQLEPTFGDSDLILNFKDNEYMIKIDFINFFNHIFKEDA